MEKFAIASAVEAAYWFLQFAEKNNSSLDDEKLHHLLFLAQTSYKQNSKNEILFPSMFVVTKNGFFEPNLLKIFAFGHPYMQPIKLNEKTDAFLKSVWQKYAALPLAELRHMITQSAALKKFYTAQNVYAVSVDELASCFEPEKKNTSSRIRMSQHGPVVVSQWNPRKINKSD